MSCKNNKSKASAPIWNEELGLPERSYSLSDVQTYFEYTFKNMEKKTDDLSIRIYVHKKENRITFKIKTGYYLELLTTETMKLLGSTKITITKDKKGKDVPHLEITEVVLVHCNIVNTDYQQDSIFLYTFILNKSFGQLLDISAKNFIFLKIFDSEFFRNH